VAPRSTSDENFCSVRVTEALTVSNYWEMLCGIQSRMGEGLSDRMYAAETTGGSPPGEPDEVADCAEPFQIRGHLQTLLSLKLIRPRDERFFLVLQQALARSPKFFRHAPVVLDAGAVAGEPPLNLAEFARRLRQQHLVPVGLQNGDEAWSHMAVNAGLALLPAGRPTKLAPDEPTATPSEDPAPRRNGTLVVREPVRAGQQIYAEDGDLIALAPVSPGAEVAADGHVHVYSRLRGRAHAGVKGDREARIFCHKLEAQLVSVAGVWLVNEDIDARFLGKRVQIYWWADALVMEPLP
jgi:septum site-determining protein MinC